MTDKYSHEAAQKRIYQAFAALVSRDERTIDLAQAALLIASVAYPDLDPVPSYNYLDVLARRVMQLRPQTSLEDIEQPNPLELVSSLNHVLFEEEHFHGNEDDYYNPDNSFLNKVIEERTGLPITLSLLYMEVGRRAGIPLEGIGLPYHFMVRYAWPDGKIYIDPFASGLLLNEAECLERLQQKTHHRGPLHARWLDPIKPKQMLVRILNNLKSTYIRREDFRHALAISDLLLLLLPDAGVEQRDRGLLHLELKHYGRAMHDLDAYLELHPQASDRYEIRNHIKQIRQTIAQLN
ncbi:SirB1 family protein [Dictyobacter kobayashii]|nr:transglutaminase-like domain-containing protein [Dictyobacter kobayashii]